MNRSHAIAAAAFSLLLTAPATAATPLDAVIDRAATNGFAGEVLVSDTHRVTYARAVSVPGRPHRRGEVWRWASVTKQLTATLVLQQVAAGHLALDDTLAMRLPEFTGANATRITLRMLLQHTSGLPNPDDSAAGADGMPAFYTRADVGAGGTADALGYCAGTPKAEPGAGFSYDNCDYIVLGAVLEHAAGRSFARLLQSAIAGPLGLHSVRLARGSTPPATVPGFTDKGTPEPAFVLANFGAAGAIIGTSDDLAAFDRALLTHTLLPAATTQTAWQGDPKLGYVALGAWSFPAKLAGCTAAVALVERRGEIGGVEVRNLLAPEMGRALIVFADRAGLDFGEIWQGKGLSYDLASAAFCTQGM